MNLLFCIIKTVLCCVSFVLLDVIDVDQSRLQTGGINQFSCLLVNYKAF